MAKGLGMKLQPESGGSYGYLIGTDVNPNRLSGYNSFSSGKGWFSTTDIREHTARQTIGELYSEILFYDDIVDRAKKRLEVYRERLNFQM